MALAVKEASLAPSVDELSAMLEMLDADEREKILQVNMHKSLSSWQIQKSTNLSMLIPFG
jgi:hypothetical protein